jgi:hypothetical protein
VYSPEVVDTVSLLLGTKTKRHNSFVSWRQMPMDVNNKVNGIVYIYIYIYIYVLLYLHSQDRIWSLEHGNTTYKSHLNKFTVFVDCGMRLCAVWSCRQVFPTVRGARVEAFCPFLFLPLFNPQI